MKLNCCKGCEWKNDKLKCAICEVGVQEMTMKLYNESKADKGCATCKNCKHMYNYPSIVTAEECICTVGLQCDTVLFEVKNCPEWVGMFESEV